MSQARQVLLGGGTGFIGSHLADILKKKGYGVVVVSRMPGPQRLSWIEVAKNNLPIKTTAVVNVAGQNVLDPMKRWTPGFKQDVWSSRVNTTSYLAQAIEKAEIKPDVFISISGVGIYEPSPTKEYNEESEVKEFDFLSKLCLAWEGASKTNSKPPVRTVNIRSGAVLGRNGGMIKNLWVPFFLGLGGPIGNGKQFLPWIHIDDLANLIVYAIEDHTVRGVLNGVAPHVVTNNEFTNAFAKAMRRPAFFTVPTFFLNLAFSQERAKIMTEGQKVIPMRTLECGFKYKYPTIEQACQALVSPEPEYDLQSSDEFPKFEVTRRSTFADLVKKLK